MSDVIKLNVKSRGIKVKVDGNALKEDPERDRALIEQRHKEELNRYFEQGYQEGLQGAKNQYETFYTEKLLQRFEELHRLFSGFDQRILDYEKVFEKLVMETSFIIAEKIIKSEIEKDTIITRVLQESLKRVLGANDVIVRLNPSDYDNLFNNPDGVNLDDSFAKMKFEKDERIEAGGCLVETEIGSVDARISTQLAELKKHIESNLSPPSEE